MSEPRQRAIAWAPRILSILFIAFLSLFALDVFTEGHGFWRTAGDLIMHLLPSLALAAVLVAAWRHPQVGAVGYAIFGILFLLWFHRLFLAMPLFVAAILFVLSWFTARRQDDQGRRTG